MLFEVNEGDVLAGKYRIEQVLGKGGMGVVVAAWHLQLDQRVALKFLLPAALRHPETVARFGREARAAVRIRSEHVARVIDVGVLESGAPYMVMEYLEGTDLSRRVAREGPISIQEAAALLLQACEALAEAHSLGIVHRDLKPANLFLTRYPDGTAWVKILDFGISKLTSPGSGDAAFDMTNTASVMGSPYYMSPEQMRSTRSVDARTDIWAIGVILYELVSGRVPFDAPTMPQLCGMVLEEAPAALRALNPEIPAGFEALVLRCLEKDPARRFQSVAELALALGDFAPKDSARSVERISRLSGAPLATTQLASESLATEAEHSTRTDFGATAAPGGPSRGLVALIILVVAAVGFAALSLRRPSSTLKAPSPSSSALVEPLRSAEASRPSAPSAMVESPIGMPSPSPHPTSSESLPNRPRKNSWRNPPAVRASAPASTPSSDAALPKASPKSNAPNPLDGRL